MRIAVNWMRSPATLSLVVAREGGRSSIPETSMIKPRGRGVLDAPPSRGMTLLSGSLDVWLLRRSTHGRPARRAAPKRDPRTGADPRTDCRKRDIDTISGAADHGVGREPTPAAPPRRTPH